MKKSKVLTLVTLLFFLSGCATSINYSSVSVPEEGGAKFVKITKETDMVRGPSVELVDVAGQSADEEGEETLQFSVSKLLAVSGNGHRVAFFAEKNDRRNIYIKDLAAGQGVLQRTFRDTKTIDGVSLSPDGNNLAFSDFRDGSWNIYSVNANAGAAVRQITTSNSHEYSPVYSPDGKAILFLQSEIQRGKAGEVVSSKSYLWTYSLSSGALTQYVEGKAPSYLPDGQRVVISRHNRDTGYNDLWLVDLENGQEFSLASSKTRGFDMPSVSPDGKKVLFVSRSTSETVSDNLDLYLINIDGSDLQQLTFHPGHDMSPQWTNSGGSVVFLSQRGTEEGDWNIWRMDLQSDLAAKPSIK